MSIIPVSLSRAFVLGWMPFAALGLVACNVPESATFSGRFDWRGASRVQLSDTNGDLRVPTADAQAGVNIDRTQDRLALHVGDRDFHFALPEGVAAKEGVWGFLSPEVSGQPTASLRAKFEQTVTDSYDYPVNEPCRAWGICRKRPMDPLSAQYCDGFRAVTYRHEEYVDTLTLELGDSRQTAESFSALGVFVGTRADSGDRKVGTATCQIPFSR